MQQIDKPYFLRHETREDGERSEVMRALEALWESVEVQALAGSFENNRFHGGEGEETVLAHTQLVVDATSDIVTGERQVFVEPDLKKALHEHMGTPVSDESPQWTWGAVSLALGITHDIGKGVRADPANDIGGVVVNADGTTGSPGHERQSARMLPALLDRLAEQGVRIPEAVRSVLATVVEHHGDFYPLVLFNEPQDTQDLPLHERARVIAQQQGIDDPRILATIFTNVLGDTEAGRRKDPEGKYPDGFGFSNEHKARGTEIFADIVSRLQTHT